MVISALDLNVANKKILGLLFWIFFEQLQQLLLPFNWYQEFNAFLVSPPLLTIWFTWLGGVYILLTATTESKFSMIILGCFIMNNLLINRLMFLPD